MGCSASKLDSEKAVQLCKDRNKFIREAIEHRTKFSYGQIAYIQAIEKVTNAMQEYISTSSESSTPLKLKSNSSYNINYYKSSGNSSVTIEQEPPQSPKTFKVQVYSPSIHHFGKDEDFITQSFPGDLPSCDLPSPQSSQWDFFWDPFSSLDYYDYLTRSNLDDENVRVQKVRDGENMKELNDEGIKKDEMIKPNNNFDGEEIVVEGHESTEEAEAQNVCLISIKETEVVDCESKEETPKFTVYVDRRPKCMAEVVKDLQDQFKVAFNAAGEVSSIVDSSRAQFSSLQDDLTAWKMSSPVALFRLASLRSPSSNEKGCKSSNDLTEEPCMFSGSLQSTLDRLYVWEKKLYHEVKAGVRLRLAYEKKCAQLMNLDGEGKANSFVDKTSSAIRNLRSQIKVSINSVEAISKRIEMLRNEELEPQLLELMQGMWKVMAECHQLQKHTLDEAKILLAGKTPGLDKSPKMLPPEPHGSAHPATNLEKELKNWRDCFNSWIISQRSFLHALKRWLSCCISSNPSISKFPSIFEICINWCKLLDSISEDSVLDGIDFLASGIGSLSAQQLTEDSRVEEKRAENTERVICAGMSVALSSLTVYSVSLADGYADLVDQWDSTKMRG